MDVAFELTTETLAAGVAELSRRDPHLAAVVARHGAPPLWDRPPGFVTLVQIILEQQVSLASGRAAYARLDTVADGVSPERIARLEDTALRKAGLTRQKASYIRGLAQAIVAGEFDPDSLANLDDDTARATLVKLRGIGAWTADIYLLMALGRADIWPADDLALLAAIREVKRMRSLPSPGRVSRITGAWRPWRAVAARVLWHHYLSTPRARANVNDATSSWRRRAARSSRPAPKDPPSGKRSRTPSRVSAGGASSKPPRTSPPSSDRR